MQNDKNNFGTSMRSHPTRPPQVVARNQNKWGIEWKNQIDKTNDWVAWRWENVKIDKESLALPKKIVHIPKEDMEDYHWVMFTHAMDFFQEHASLKKPIPNISSQAY
jgi:hypothetical protein